MDPVLSRILLLVAYDGAPFCGFAQQTNAPTVASTIDRAIAEIDPTATRIVGASRTDSGVHARCQPVAFTSHKQIASRGWVLALTTRLPHSIGILRAARVDIDFDPRRHAQWKRYRYRILRSQVEDPWLTDRAWRVGQRLDVELMESEARELVGRHDFAAFRSIGDQRTTTVRHIRRVRLSPVASDPRCLDIEVEGDKFLYNMVRIIVGTLVDVGRGRLAPGAVSRALASLSRIDLGMTAPSAGLCLEHVELDVWGNDAWPDRAGGAPV